MQNVGRGRCGKTQERRATKLLFFLQPLVLPNFFSPLHPLFFPTPSRRARHLSSSNPHHPTHRHLCIATTPFHQPFVHRRLDQHLNFLSHASVKQTEINHHPCPDKSGMFVPQPSKFRFLHPFLPQNPPSLSIDSVRHQRTAINQFTSETPKQPTSDRRGQCEFDCALSCLLPVIKIISRATSSFSGGLPKRGLETSCLASVSLNFGRALWLYILPLSFRHHYKHGALRDKGQVLHPLFPLVSSTWCLSYLRAL